MGVLPFVKGPVHQFRVMTLINMFNGLGRHLRLRAVSTAEQGRSGVGLEAQKAAVEQRLNGGPWQLVGEFTEIESGRRAKRPQLEAARKACKKHKAKLVVAKLDRLSRNTRFLLTLIESGVSATCPRSLAPWGSSS